MPMQIRPITETKAIENYRRTSSIRTELASKTQAVKNPLRNSDTVQFSQEALDKLRVQIKTEKDHRIQGERLRNNQDEQLTRSLEILKLDRSVSKAVITRAYHYLLQSYHPDKYFHLPPEFRELAEVKAKEIIEAYNKLTK
jgi:DnaJ-domain-containing protein 1